jgi:hypothetical protein
MKFGSCQRWRVARDSGYAISEGGVSRHAGSAMGFRCVAFRRG